MCGLSVGVRRRDEILLPFLRAGLEAGDKCICIVDGTAPTEIIAALGALGAESTPAGAKRLDVILPGNRTLVPALRLVSTLISAPEGN